MIDQGKDDVRFVRLTEISEETIQQHMSDPKVSKHMPLMKTVWNINAVRQFVKAKEAHWKINGLGHCAILHRGEYVGWGGFQKEGNDWDFGLVLNADSFGLGLKITRIALDMAKKDDRIPYVTFLLPPSRINLGAFKRMGAEEHGQVTYEGDAFLKFRLDTS